MKCFIIIGVSLSEPHIDSKYSAAQVIMYVCMYVRTSLIWSVSEPHQLLLMKVLMKGFIGYTRNIDGRIHTYIHTYVRTRT